MRASLTKNGLTLRVIAGTHSAILGIDLQENKRAGCLGFSIQRTNLGPAGKPFAATKQMSRWLPNMLRFPDDTRDPAVHPITTEDSPLQKFRWGDYTLQPATTYRFQVVPKFGQPGTLTAQDGLGLEGTFPRSIEGGL